MTRFVPILAGMLIPAAAFAQTAPSTPAPSTPAPTTTATQDPSGTTTTAPSTPRDDRTGTTEERIEKRDYSRPRTRSGMRRVPTPPTPTPTPDTAPNTAPPQR